MARKNGRTDEEAMNEQIDSQSATATAAAGGGGTGGGGKGNAVKEAVLKEVSERFVPKMEWKKNRKGRVATTNFDVADSILVAQFTLFKYR